LLRNTGWTGLSVSSSPLPISGGGLVEVLKMEVRKVKILARIEVIEAEGERFYVVNLVAYADIVSARRALGELVKQLRSEAKVMVAKAS